MSLYKNLIEDLPCRNKQVMDLFYQDSEENKLNVSFLLMVATSGFIIPYETFMKEDKNYFNTKANKKSCQKIISETKTLFGYINGFDINAFEQCEKKYEENFKSCRSEYFSIIRNALAHGNILVIDEQSDSKIHNIIFISENKNEDEGSSSHKFLEFKVEEFKKFLVLWFEFIISH